MNLTSSPPIHKLRISPNRCFAMFRCGTILERKVYDTSLVEIATRPTSLTVSPWVDEMSTMDTASAKAKRRVLRNSRPWTRMLAYGPRLIALAVNWAGHPADVGSFLSSYVYASLTGFNPRRFAAPEGMRSPM